MSAGPFDPANRRKGTARLSIVLVLAAGFWLPSAAMSRESLRYHDYRLRPLSTPASPGGVRAAAPPVASDRNRAFPCVLRSEGSAPARPGRIRSISEFVKDAAAVQALKSDGGFESRSVGRERTTGTRGAANAATGRIDTLRVAFLRCDFTDNLKPDSTTGNGRFMFSDTEPHPVDPPPHNRAYFGKHGEALRRYYSAQSQGHLVIEPHVFPVEGDSAFHLGDMASYGPWRVSVGDANIPIRAERLIKDAFEAARVSGQLDFKSFDAFIVVHAGADFQSDINNDTPYDIPTFVLQFGDTVIVDGKRIDRAMVLPETNTQDGRFAALNGTLAHEFGHILGLYDLYNTLNGVPVVGRWSLMDSGENIPAILVDPTDSSEVEVSGAVPTSIDAWSRLQLFGDPDSLGGGFLLDHFHVAGESLSTTLPAVVEASDIAYAEISDQEYYLVENREAELDGNDYPIIRQDRETGVILGPEVDSTLTSTAGALEYDALLPGSGLVVWHIDQRMLPGGDLASPWGVNVNPYRRAIKVVEADAIDDLEWRTTGNYGTPWDPFYAGNNAVFGPNTLPPTRSNDGQVTNITIETSSPAAPVMAVKILRRSALDGWPIGSIPGVKGDHVNVMDVTGDGSPEMLLVIEKAVYALEGRGGRPFPAPNLAGNLTPFFTFNIPLDHRLAMAGTFEDRSGGASNGVIAAWARNAGNLELWDRSGRKLGEFNGALTPAAIGSGYIAYANAIGGVDLGGIVGGAPQKLYTSPAHIDRDPAGNVLVGALDDPAGAEVEAVLSSTSGTVHVYSTRNATPQESGPAVLAEIGNSPVLGASPLSLLAANFEQKGTARYEVASVDPNGRAALIDLLGNLQPGWPVELPAPMVGYPAAGDVDLDGSAELVVADTLGTLNVLNGDGSPAIGFPIQLGSKPTTGPMLADVDGRPGPEIIVLTGDGSLRAYGAGGKAVAGFPIAMGNRTLSTATLVDLNADGRLDVAGERTSLPFAVSLARSVPDSAIVWAGEQNGADRNAVLDRRFATAGGSLSAARLNELVCYPNPARGDAMHVRLFVEPGQSAHADIFDLLGRPVAERLPSAGGGQSGGEAEILWDLSGVAPGVYMIRVTRSGNLELGSRSDVRWRTVSVVR